MSASKKIAYQEYRLDDFLTDEFFVKWVKQPTPETSHFWDKWIAQHPEQLTKVLKAKQLIEAVGYEHKHEISDQAYTEMYEEVMRQSPQPLFSTHRGSGNWIVNIAAIVVLVLGGTFVYQWQHARPEQAIPAQVWVVKQTPKGTKLSFTLPDGTLVKLNAGSSIKYPETFAGTVREVELEGEAFFEVTENKALPFIVKGGSWRARVLGTSFNMQTTGGNPSVALLTGKVAVSDGQGQRVVLEPLQKVSYNKEKIFRVANFDPQSALAWKDGRLVFDRTPFEEAIEVLENWYGVEIRTAGHLQIQGGFSGIYENETLENVLRGLSTTSGGGFAYQIRGREVLLEPLNLHP